nr:ABC transporter substrate-binding protein [Petrachloros mirabilis]
MLIVSVACSQPAAQDPDPIVSSGNRLTIGTTSKARTLDPADAYEVFAGNLLYNLGEGLYRYEIGTDELQPQLATAMPTISDDRLTYRIPLREGVFFHDGTPFNAEAMAFSLRRFMENGGPPSFLLTDIVESIEPTGEYELTIRLQRPFAGFSDLLAFSGLAAVSPEAYEIGAGAFSPSTFVGTGPYQLTRYDGGDTVRLDTFEDYWGSPAVNEGIDIQVYSSSANLYNAFRTGAIDVATQSLEPDQLQALERAAENGDWQSLTGPGNVVSYLSLNVQDEHLSKPQVRQALAAMIDRNVLRDRVFQQQAEPLYSLIPTIFEVSQPVFEQNRPNQAEIEALLTEAGYSPDNPVPLTLWYRSNVASNVLAATTLRAMITRDYGNWVQFNLDSVESATAYQNLDKGIYPMFMLDWYGDFYDPDNYIHPFIACEQGSVEAGCERGASHSQGSFYYSDRANQLVEQSRQETDPARRQEVFAQIQTLIAEDVPFIPLWQNNASVFAQGSVEGVQLQPTQQFPFWTLSKS